MTLLFFVLARRDSVFLEHELPPIGQKFPLIVLLDNVLSTLPRNALCLYGATEFRPLRGHGVTEGNVSESCIEKFPPKFTLQFPPHLVRSLLLMNQAAKARRH